MSISGPPFLRFKFQFHFFYSGGGDKRLWFKHPVQENLRLGCSRGVHRKRTKKWETEIALT